jgi:hypothetical protein
LHQRSELGRVWTRHCGCSLKVLALPERWLRSRRDSQRGIQ